MFARTAPRWALLPRRTTPLVTQRVWQSTDVAATATTIEAPAQQDPKDPKLVAVPTLPLVGSTLSWYSKTPPLGDNTKAYETWPELRRRFGDFYSIGFPGLGEGLHGTLHVLQDPNEFMKILRREGVYPTSIVEKQWAFRQYFEDTGFGRVMGLMNHGPEWKRIRSFLQTDLLSPQSAARYIPGILRAAEYASKGALSYGKDLKIFLNQASLDMFSMILLGDLPRITDPSTESRPEDVAFCRHIAAALAGNTKLGQDMKSMLLMKMFGIKSDVYKEFEDNWSAGLEIADEKIKALLAKRDAGTLTKEEADSYLNQAMDRQLVEQESSEDPVTVEEVMTIAKLLLSASVDTTSGMMSWHLLHIAQNPEVQERIRSELLKTGDNGKLTPESISLSNAPYLHAAIREGHRLTSPAPLSAFRVMPDDVQVHGVTIPQNSTVAFDGYSRGRDPDLLDNVDEFIPDRWLPEAVASRKGTPAEVLDHPLFSGPFSQGARRCPGSRVSRNEVNILLAQLVLDWEMTTDVKSWKEVKPQLETVITADLPKIEFQAR